MAMTVLWMAMVTASILCGLATGRMPQVSAAATEGAAAAVQLCLSMAGVMCLWCGVMEVMRRCGLLCGLERILRPLLGRLFPEAARQPETMEKIAANVSANLLGLGNAATPLGIQAVRRMRQGDLPECPPEADSGAGAGTEPDGLCSSGSLRRGRACNGTAVGY